MRYSSYIPAIRLFESRTLGKPCGVACWAARVLVVEVTLPVELLLPVPLESPFESSRLNENLFGLRLKLATLFVTISCRELKKLIFVAFYVWCVCLVVFCVNADVDCSKNRECHYRLLCKFFRNLFLRIEIP